MRTNTALTGVVIPGLLAGMIYFVIAVATGAPAVAAVIGGVVVAAIAIAIGLMFRTVFKRRAASR
jgi:Na+/H+-translocating membrane pyrophosphatase